MGTYQQAISRLGEKLRDSEAWPSDSSKESEQLYLLYNAAIAVLRGIPKSRLTPVVVTDLTVQDVDDDLKEALLPANCFFFRPDAGIRRYFFDSGLHYTRSSIPTRSIGALKNNYMHKGEVLFAEEFESQRIVFTNASQLKFCTTLSQCYPEIQRQTTPWLTITIMSLLWRLSAPMYRGKLYEIQDSPHFRRS